MQEENQVAEIEEIEEEKSSPEPEATEEEIQKKKLRDLKFELALFFILGVLVGITIKTEAVKSITMGFNDFQLKNGKQGYDVEKIKAEITQQAKKAQEIQGEAQNSTGPQIETNPPVAN